MRQRALLGPLLLALLIPADGAEELLEQRYLEPGDWLSYDRDNSARRYSPLAQIHTGNVDRLAVRWAFQFRRIPTRTEVTPIVRNGIMYITVGGDEAYAVDARTGRALWHFNYIPTSSTVINWNRGMAVSGNRVFMATADAKLLALDARNGSLLWKVELADPENGYGATSAPFIVKNLVIQGIRGGDTGKVRGFLDAYDAETGKLVWRFHTVPAPGEPGSETWPATEVWKVGGAATWTTGSYDPNLNLVYWPTGNPGPKDYDGGDRAGDNLFSCSLLAIDADTGKLRWHYQFTPHDLHDWDSNETPVLVNAVWRGKARKLVLHANRNGFFYVLDRSTGELLLARPFIRQTWAKEIGPDGRPLLLANTEPSARGTKLCPDAQGANNWQSASYNPATGLLHVSAREACAIYYPTGPALDESEEPARQSLKAIDIQTGEIKWTVPFVAPPDVSHAGSATTAGGLVFFANRDGYFMAADARSGKVLWHFYTGGSIGASPMTYMAGGKQYVAIATKGALFSFALP